MGIKNIIVRLLRIVIITCFCFLISWEVKATHIVGSDITFTCKSQDFYEVHLTVRRDCINGDEEAVFDDPGYVGIFNEFGSRIEYLGSLGLIRMELMSVEQVPVEVDGVCFSNTTGLCVTEAKYVGEVFLPYRENDYFLAYQRCCRNITLNNILNPLESGTTALVEVTEESLNTCNSSPILGDWPDVVVCVGEPLGFDGSATDLDGDSLSYKFYTPFQGASLALPQPIPPSGPPYDSVEYALGFSLDNLLGAGDPLKINQTTGLVTATPGIIGQFLVGILIEEWRDGIKISEIRRDFEYNVVVCDNSNTLSFESVDLSCGELTLEFENTSTDLTRDFTWNFNYPSDDPAFMSNEVSPTFTFPDFGDYVVKLTSEGDEPTCNSEFVKEISIVDSEVTASCAAEVGDCIDGLRTISVRSTSTENSQLYDLDSTVLYVTIEETVTRYKEEATFELECFQMAEVKVVAYSSSGCIDETVKILPDNFFDWLADTIIICQGASTVLLNTSLDPSYMYEWTPEESLDLSDPLNPIASPTETTQYVVMATDSAGNVLSDSVLVQVDLGIVNIPDPNDIADVPGRICMGDTATVTLNLPPSDNFSVKWDSSVSIISGLTGEEVMILGMSETGSIVLTYTVTNDDGCQVEGQVVIQNSTIIDPVPVSEVQCGTYEIQFNIDPIYADGDVFWDFGIVNGDSLTSTDANPIIDFRGQGVYDGLLTSTMETCNFDPLAVSVEVPEILEISSDQDLDQFLCMGDSLVTLSANSNGPIIQWTDQDGNPLDSGDSVVVDVREVSMVVGTIQDTFGCSESITFNTGIYEFDITLDIPTEPVCSNDPLTINAINNNGDNITYMWVSANGIESGADTPNPMVIPGQAEDLILIVTNERGCTMEFPAPVSGGSEIEATIIADPDRPIVNGEPITLTVQTDAVNPTFMWSDGSTGSSITVSPEETTTYTVVVTEENSCTAETSYTVEVEASACDPSGVFIPDAFSPNMDNMNDQLFVRGNNIQSIDFQVIDRWGKELFRTSSQTEGWNGRFRQNGDELSPDVYAYRVRVTCPDGSEFLKAGNVSLIR